MAKLWSAVIFIAMALVLNGCGGSSSIAGAVNTGGGTSSPQYTANLPDGSPMDIEVVDEGAGDISGSFAVAAATGPYAFEAGSFDGTVNGQTVSMDCTTGDGTEFQMTGTQTSGGFQLTRSDIPGTVLTFTLEEASPKFRTNTSGSVSTKCTLGTAGTTGKLTIGTNAYSVQGPLTEYRGTFAGVPATFWQYNTGQANIVLYIDPLIVDTATYGSLRLTDLPTVTVNSSAAALTTYSTVTKTSFRTGHGQTCSP